MAKTGLWTTKSKVNTSINQIPINKLLFLLKSGHVVVQLPMIPKDVYLQDGCWHALWDRAVDHGEAPFHGSMKLMLAHLLGQEDPCCSAEAAAKLSSAWLGAQRGVNDAEQQWQAESRETATLCVTWTERPGKVLTREGSSLLQRSLLWWKPLAKKLTQQPRLESRTGIKKYSSAALLLMICWDKCKLHYLDVFV